MRVNLRWWLAAALLACASVQAVETLPAAPAASSVPAAAPCPPPPVAPTPDEMRSALHDAVDGGLLWKATRDGRSLWLYGTIHVAQKAWMFPGPRVLKAVTSSDTIALELDPADPDIVARLRQALVRRPGSPTLPEALQRRLLAQMAAACVAPETLAELRPEMQAISVEVLAGREFGLYPDYGIDAFLSGLGHALNKTVRSLETPESQAQLLVSDDPAETARSVCDLLDEMESGKGPALLHRLAGDWRRGDLDDLDAYASWCGCLDTAQQRDDFAKLVDARNPLMADKIVQWHAQGSKLFVAVGSLHMLGPAGLPALLAARGFDVERVAFADAH